MVVGVGGNLALTGLIFSGNADGLLKGQLTPT